MTLTDRRLPHLNQRQIPPLQPPDDHRRSSVSNVNDAAPLTYFLLYIILPNNVFLYVFVRIHYYSSTLVFLNPRSFHSFHLAPCLHYPNLNRSPPLHNINNIIFSSTPAPSSLTQYPNAALSHHHHLHSSSPPNSSPRNQSLPEPSPPSSFPAATSTPA